MIIAYVTCGSESEAKALGSNMVRQKLAACANYFPIKSIFSWKQELKEEHEYVLLLKTRNSLLGQLEEEIKKLHSYETPCIIAIAPESVSKEYSKWVKDSTR